MFLSVSKRCIYSLCLGPKRCIAGTEAFLVSLLRAKMFVLGDKHEEQHRGSLVPIPSMSGIFAYIWLIFMVNVSKYTIHG